MNDIEVSSIDLVEGGNVFKQGHYLTLGYVPRDEKGELVNLSDKTLSVALWGRKGIVFESSATYSGGVIRFTLNNVIPAGQYQVEFTATSSDSGYRKKFPTNDNAGRIIINQSTDDAGAVGISVYTVAQFEKKQKEIQEAYQLTVNGKVAELENEFNAAVSGLTSDSEVIIARENETTLNQRLKRDKDMLQNEIASAEEKAFFGSLINRKKQGLLSVLIDDDGQTGVYTKMIPLIRELGIRMTSAIITNRGHGFPIEGLPAHNPLYMSYEQIEESKDVLEIVPHSDTHDVNYRYTDMTVAEIHADMKKNKEIIRKLGGNYRNIVFPFGAINNTVVDVARQYFDSGFDISGGMVQSPMDQYRMPRLGLDSKTFEDVKPAIDAAKENNTGMALMTHVDQYGGLSITVLRQVLEYMISLGFEFVTVSEFVDRFGNLAQFKGATISSAGEIDGKYLGVYRNEGLDLPANANITSFKKGTITRTKVRSADYILYGLDETQYTTGYGFVETHRDNSEDTYSFQLFHHGTQSATVKRVWDNANNKWGKWSNTSTLNPVGFNVIGLNSSPSTYAAFKETIEKVRSADAAAYGLPTGGVIRTYRDTENPYTYQQFIPTSLDNFPIMYRSSASGGGSWGGWNSTVVKLSSYSKTLTGVVVPAKSTKNELIQLASALSTNFYVRNLSALPPNGIHIDVICPVNGTLYVQVLNATDSAVTLPELVVSIRRLAM